MGRLAATAGAAEMSSLRLVRRPEPIASSSSAAAGAGAGAPQLGQKRWSSLSPAPQVLQRMVPAIRGVEVAAMSSSRNSRAEA